MAQCKNCKTWRHNKEELHRCDWCLREVCQYCCVNTDADAPKCQECGGWTDEQMIQIMRRTLKD